MGFTLISYCNNTWPSIGGVARYDTQLSLVFPDRIFFKGPSEKDMMLEYLETCKAPIIITDNHLACDIPNKYPVIIVHHGCALTTSKRNPDWDPYWRDLCCNGQHEMLYYRNLENTMIISISKACTDDFTYYFPDLYPKFKRLDIIHPSEFDESIYKEKFNDKPVILGNWDHIKKGRHLIPHLKELLPEFEFRQLKILPLKGESLESFNRRKQDIYLECDIFLQIANSEGFSYASNDAMLCGLVPICTDVGGFYGDVPDSCFMRLDWEKCYGDLLDYEYIKNKIVDAWNNKEQLSTNARNWYLENCLFSTWSEKMKSVINDFYNEQYN
jgi:glycosyltransferase involved in cell wall biosynthesis